MNTLLSMEVLWGNNIFEASVGKDEGFSVLLQLDILISQRRHFRGSYFCKSHQTFLKFPHWAKRFFQKQMMQT